MKIKRDEKRGLLVSVYRSSHPGDTTNAGPTSFYNAFVLIDKSIQGPFLPIKGIPELQLRNVNFGHENYTYAVPAALIDKNPMFGGNFVWTSDSRLRKVAKYPIPVHDRVESTLHFDGLPD